MYAVVLEFYIDVFRAERLEEMPGECFARGYGIG
jgi:hypothetical protein